MYSHPIGQIALCIYANTCNICLYLMTLANMQTLHRALLALLLWNISLQLTESVSIVFSGFTEGDTYAYYTNRDSAITELTCVATDTDKSVNSISTYWYLKASDSETNTSSSVLRFVDTAAALKWGEKREYFCRAVYENGQGQEQEDSGNIVVAIECELSCYVYGMLYNYTFHTSDNTTITVSYRDTVYVRDITNRERVPLPVMTEGVVISCDAEGGEWSYQKSSTGMGLSGQVNPINIALFTLEYSVTFECTKIDPSGARRTVHRVTLQAVGE